VGATEREGTCWHGDKGTLGEKSRAGGPDGSRARERAGSHRERVGLENGRQRGNRPHITRSAAECSVR
jgi:hypothetical protein